MCDRPITKSQLSLTLVFSTIALKLLFYEKEKVIENNYFIFDYPWVIKTPDSKSH